MKFFAGLEANCFAWSNVTSAPVLGLRPMPVLRGLTVKNRSHAVRCGRRDEGLLHAVEDGVYRRLLL